ASSSKMSELARNPAIAATGSATPVIAGAGVFAGLRARVGAGLGRMLISRLPGRRPGSLELGDTAAEVVSPRAGIDLDRGPRHAVLVGVVAHREAALDHH